MTDTAGLNSEHLKSIIERIEFLEQEKGNLADDVKEIYAEAKGVGYDTKILRALIRLRKMDVSQRQEHEELLRVYQHALGMTP